MKRPMEPYLECGLCPHAHRSAALPPGIASTFHVGRQGQTKGASHPIPPPLQTLPRCLTQKLPLTSHRPELCHTPTILAAREARNTVVVFFFVRLFVFKGGTVMLQTELGLC